MDHFYFVSKGEKDTARAAETLAPYLRLGDVILLTGSLACGKTYFVKFLAHALGSNDLVASPTYSIIHSHNIRSGHLLHMDVYRLSSDIREFTDLGIEEFFHEAVVVIEWGEKVAEFFESYMSIGFDIAAGPYFNHRILSFSFTGQRWAEDAMKLKENIGGSDHRPDFSS